MRKAIYIRATQVEWLKLDGPSLLVKIKNKSAQRFPIIQIKRIVIIGYLKKEVYALFYIAEKGVPTFFTDNQYKAKLELISFNHKKSCFCDNFQMMVDEPSIYKTVVLWFEKYHQDLKNQYKLNKNIIINQPYKTVQFKKNQQKLTAKVEQELMTTLKSLIKLIIIEQLYSIGLQKTLIQQDLQHFMLFALKYYIKTLIIESLKYIVNDGRKTVTDWGMAIFIKHQQAIEYQISKIIHKLGYFLCELSL